MAYKGPSARQLAIPKDVEEERWCDLYIARVKAEIRAANEAQYKGAKPDPGPPGIRYIHVGDLRSFEREYKEDD